MLQKKRMVNIKLKKNSRDSSPKKFAEKET